MYIWLSRKISSHDNYSSIRPLLQWYAFLDIYIYIKRIYIASYSGIANDIISYTAVWKIYTYTLYYKYYISNIIYIRSSFNITFCFRKITRPKHLRKQWKQQYIILNDLHNLEGKYRIMIILLIYILIRVIYIKRIHIAFVQRYSEC